ncbi:MAG: phosphoenolpyruvate carboxykinase (GTP), partial [bacterium]
KEPKEAKEMLNPLFKDCMKGRTMYVLPYMMGNPESAYSKACIQLTDSSYVAVSTRIMTRKGKAVLEKIGNSFDFVKGLHSVGDFSPKRRFIMHFPDESLVWSIGSGYGGNALLGKKCFSLRIASFLGLKENWLAEHMVIMGIEDPSGNTTYITAALPSACGKTNLAMLNPSLPGYKIWTIGDDIAWMNLGDDGRLYAINPEMGFFGVAPGTSEQTNPNMIKTLKNGTFYPTLFTNTALATKTNEPWWDGLDGIPEGLIDWKGNSSSSKDAAHPNSRFTVSITQCPTLSSEFNNPKGVPISAIIFGCRRSSVVPLVYEAFNWQNGVFQGCGMASETTSAAVQDIGVLRRDPMAMLPFCGYNMADYWEHWRCMEEKMESPPKIFFVNWFRKDEGGNFLWPGFSENIRVLKWIVDRVKGRVGAKETPIGFIPDSKDLDLTELNINEKGLFKIDKDEWKKELLDIKAFLLKFGNRLPSWIEKECECLEKRLS